jgi:hypothetical protein
LRFFRNSRGARVRVQGTVTIPFCQAFVKFLLSFIQEAAVVAPLHTRADRLGSARTLPGSLPAQSFMDL